MNTIRRNILISLGGAVLLMGCSTPQGAVSVPETPAPESAVTPSSEPAPAAPAPVQKTAGPLRAGGSEAYMDRMERGLRALMRGQAIRIMRRADMLVVDLPVGRILAGKQISSDGGQILHNLARVLRYFNHTGVQVNGYTDTHGSFDGNVRRSQRYAARVLSALARQGVAGARMQSHGFGESALAVPTGDGVREGRNNRVELVISPRA